MQNGEECFFVKIIAHARLLKFGPICNVLTLKIFLLVPN